MRLRLAWLGAVLAAALVAPTPASAARLPIRPFTMEHGLADDSIRKIVCDSRGLLWFCTVHALSRFDGYSFVNYDRRHGLPDATVNDVLADEDGNLWVATGAGLYRLDASAGRSDFVEVPGGPSDAFYVVALARDRSGRIWIGASEGLFVVEAAERGVRLRAPTRREVPVEGVGTSGVRCLHVDRDGGLWVGTVDRGLILVDQAGGVTRFTARDGLPSDAVTALATDREGGVWVGTTGGAGRLAPLPGPGPRRWGRVSRVPGSEGPVAAIHEARDGTVWVASVARGLGVWTPSYGGAETPWRLYGTADGLTDPGVTAIAEDREGNVWIGGESSGAVRIARAGFTSWGEADGLAVPRIASIHRAPSGELWVRTSSALYLIRADGAVVPAPGLGDGVFRGYWGWNEEIAHDRGGGVWIPTVHGVRRYRNVAGFQDLASRAPRVYTTRDGLAGDDVFRIFGASDGAVWIVSLSMPASLTRLDPATGHATRFGKEEGLRSAATVLREDADGDLWLGLYDGGIARRREGRFECFGAADGVPAGMVRDLLFDSRGWLWIAATKGVAVVENPRETKPRIRSYTTDDGLSSRFVSCLAEDRFGRIYLGTDRGIDRLEPRTGQIDRFTTADGLPNSFVNVAYRDTNGDLWFGTLRGLARLTPEPDAPAAEPPTYLARVSIGGREQPLPPVGAARVEGLTLAEGEGPVEISFFAPSFGVGRTVRYQHRLDGDVAWTLPSDGRTVTLGNAAVGAHTFEARAIRAGEREGGPAATVSFVVLAPFWRRGWFLAVSVVVSGGALLARSRYRIRALRRHEDLLAQEVATRTTDLNEAKLALEEWNRTLERRVSEGIAALRESERMAAYGRLVAGVVHEIRHPIFALQTVAYMLARKLRGRDDLDRQVRALRIETERMGHLMDDLLDFARPTALVLAPARPHELLEEAATIFRTEHPDSALAVDVSPRAPLPDAVVDSRRIVQVLVNLMENARKHAKGASRIVLTADGPADAERTGRGGTIRLQVRDDGAGIPPEHLARVFEPFYTTGNGAGLGLAIVERIVHDHGGTIEALSEVGRGTVFSIDLPAGGPPAPPARDDR